MSKNKVILIIMDGWGIGDRSRSDAIHLANPEFINSLYKSYPSSKLFAHGNHVGLPENQMGNSEVGHSNIGAGRILFQDLVRINNDIEQNRLELNPQLQAAFHHATEKKKAVHFIGLVSDGGVHSVNQHLYALLDLAKRHPIEQIYIHAITDGRDTDPRSGIGFIRELMAQITDPRIVLASVIGRYYAMDRDKRWERVKIAYDCFVHGTGKQSRDIIRSMEESYEEGITDEFIKPIKAVTNEDQPSGLIRNDDVVICFNFRTDRLRELTEVLTQKSNTDHQMFTMPLYYVTLTNYNEAFENIHIIYDKENVGNTLGEVLARHGLKQLRIAETEKYPHVTFFFSGGREDVFENEDRVMVSSPKVATYDLQPEMSAYELTDRVIAEIERKTYDFICLNYANCDMVGHTGVYPAIIKAVQTVDECVRRVIHSARENGYTALISADHGNSDFAINEDGSPNTEHSLNQVPLIYVGDDKVKLMDGVLADIAPTILKVMDLPVPEEMTGNALI